VDVRIGVTYSPKELVLEMTDETDHEALRAEVEAAIAGGSPMLWLADRRGRQVGVPTDKIAYIDLGIRSERSIGFGAG
jgi:hypothetical protein